MRFKNRSLRLCEDIEGMKKFYPNIPDEKFTELVELDPTYTKGSVNAGKYARWILGIANKNKGEIENIGHVTDVLTRFEEEKNHLKNKDVMRYKSVQELEDMLNNDDSYTELSHRQEVRQRQKDRREVDVEKDADVVYTDENWTVYVPKTYAAECKLGQGTTWCTASTESDYYYNMYLRNYPGSKYYVIINNKDPKEKYQLHIESGQFMDRDDEPVDLIPFLHEHEGLYNYFHDVIADNIMNALHVVNGEIKVSNEELAEAMDNSYRRDTLSISTIETVLNGEDTWDLFDYSAYTSKQDVKTMFESGYIDQDNINAIKELGVSDEAIQEALSGDIDMLDEEKPDIIDAVGRAIEDVLTQKSESDIYATVTNAIDDACPRGINIKQTADGTNRTTFAVNEEDVRKYALDIMEMSQNGEFDEPLLNCIAYNSNGIYYNDDTYIDDSDKDDFNEFLSELLAEI